LKVFKTHIGFHDLIVAAPSMKAAAQAWGAKPTIFSQGRAAVTQETDAVAAALAQPGIVLKRPHGQAGAYKAEPDDIRMPKLSAPQKAAARQAEKSRLRQEAAERKAQAAAQRRAEQDAKTELKEIEREEAQLRARRQKLRQKFHLRSVK